MPRARRTFTASKKRGSHVSLRIFSHCHVDHYGAFLYLCEQPDFDIRVDRLCYHFPDYDWLMTKEDMRFTKKLFLMIDNRGTGGFTTLETRLWMAELNVVRSFHPGEGDLIFT